jgi:signal transduction histidine kinase/signal transduction protein with GAF and PtsI domain
MSEDRHSPDLMEIFNTLSEIPLQYRDRNNALKNVAELVKQTMRSHVCTLSFINFEDGIMSQVASTCEDKEFEEYLVGKKSSLGSAGSGKAISSELLGEGKIIEKYNLQSEGQGVANPEIARKFNFHSLLSYPLKSEDRLIGYINHFSSKSTPFTPDEKKLLEIFAHQTMIIIEKFDHLTMLTRSSSILNDLLQNLLSISQDEFLQNISEKACELFSVPVCIVWRLNESVEMMEIAAATNVDSAYRNIKLKLKDAGFEKSSYNRGVAYLSNVTRKHPQYTHPNEAKERGWVSLLSAPMRVKGRLIGMLDVYTKRLRHFRQWEIDLFRAFAHNAAISIEKAELLKKTEETVSDREKLVKLTTIMLRMAESNDIDELVEKVLKGALDLVGSDRGWISRLDDRTGDLHIIADSGNLPEHRRLKPGTGITGRAFDTEKPIRVKDVRSGEWHGKYEKFWEDTRSEIAIPILLTKAQVRIGREVKFRSKPIGVLNIESPRVNAFSQTDEDCLLSLSHQAAMMIERIENELKHAALREIEKKIVGVHDYEKIIQTVLSGIRSSLGFEYVNISLVVQELNCIRTEYVKGIPKQEVERFKSMAVHSLDSNDIQADIIKHKETEVPEVDDKRFDKAIYKRFGHERMIRVFSPMISAPDNRAIGTVEAGYQKKSRKYIYERDVQILQSFVDYAVQAFEQKRSRLLEKISHEFNAPIVGIRSNASFIQRRYADLSYDMIDTKLSDVLTDCDILLYQVAELEHILGSKSPVSKITKTYVYRDIIIKTINQLKPDVIDKKFSVSRIKYNPAYSTTIKVYVDKAKLNQVVYNLLINSIKYSEDDPNEFKIDIELEEEWDKFIIKFKDWGMGITKGLEAKIFNDGFRTPEAMLKNVSGSGLGLTIALKFMRQMGGNLKLASNSKPTEFQLILPKSLSEDPDDTFR